MSLLGWPFLLLVAATSLVVAGGTWALWNRWPPAASTLGRAISLLLVMTMGGVSAAAYTNDVYDFYASVDDVLGSVPAQRYQPPSSFSAESTDAASVEISTSQWRRLAAANAAAGHGTMLRVTLPGPISGISRKALLYLPAVYAAGNQELALPVIEMFNGYPGKPSNFTRLLHIGDVIDREIAADRMPPVIVVIPTVYEHRSSECVDAANGGERDETYLAVDVPADLASAFRTAPGRAFATLGYSEGGFCAVNLGLHHPDRYAAAASLSGYFTAGVSPKTVPYLYGRGTATRNRNSPLWWVKHRNPTGPPLWLLSSTGDPSAVRDARTMTGAAARYAPKLTVQAPVIYGGGHNFNTWLQALPAALDFLGDNLPQPLAPPLTLPQLVTDRQTPAHPFAVPFPTGTAHPRPPGATPSGHPTRATHRPPPTSPRASASAHTGPMRSPPSVSPPREAAA